MSAHKEQAAALIAAGERDLLALRLLNQTGQAPHEVIGFHTQQATENFKKIAKAFQAQALAEHSKKGTP